MPIFLAQLSKDPFWTWTGPRSEHVGQKVVKGLRTEIALSSRESVELQRTVSA